MTATGYEVKMYHDIEQASKQLRRIADALEKIADTGIAVGAFFDAVAYPPTQTTFGGHDINWKNPEPVFIDQDEARENKS